MGALFCRRKTAGRVAGEDEAIKGPARSVRLLPTSRRLAATPFERLSLSVLRREGAIPLAVLADRLARELYRDALRQGAWAAEDIGVFGKALFLSDVLRELESADGIFWAIERVEPAPSGTG